jgi:hypothetical protein
MPSSFPLLFHQVIAYDTIFAIDVPSPGYISEDFAIHLQAVSGGPKTVMSRVYGSSGTRSSGQGTVCETVQRISATGF